MAILLLVHLVVTMYMVGVIWFVQVVHYPLMSRIGSPHYSEYQRLHMQRTGWVLAGPMFIELGSAVALVLFTPAGLPIWPGVVGLLLLSLIWLSTWLVQVPCHQRLLHGFDANIHRRLVRSNWFRTGCWTLRGLIVAWMTIQLIV